MYKHQTRPATCGVWRGFQASVRLWAFLSGIKLASAGGLTTYGVNVSFGYLEKVNYCLSCQMMSFVCRRATLSLKEKHYLYVNCNV